MSRTFNPRKLVRLAAKAVNDAISDHASIRKLEIPTVCQHYIDKYYFTDNLWCDDKLPPIEESEFPYEFEIPFIKLSPDEFLSLMRYKEVPRFAYEFNHVYMYYYEIDRNNEPLCKACTTEIVRNPEFTGRTVYCMENCFISQAEELVDNLQSLDMWCSRCYTTALFKIRPWMGNIHNTFGNPTVTCEHRL